MHERNLIHRDLKPANILIMDKTDLSSIRIIDFGLSERFILMDFDARRRGTFMYMAPEVVAGNRQATQGVDIWAVGLIMHEVLSGGKHPLSKNGSRLEDRDTIRKMLLNFDQFKPDKSLSQLASHLFSHMTKGKCA